MPISTVTFDSETKDFRLEFLSLYYIFKLSRGKYNLTTYAERKVLCRNKHQLNKGANRQTWKCHDQLNFEALDASRKHGTRVVHVDRPLRAPAFISYHAKRTKTNSIKSIGSMFSPFIIRQFLYTAKECSEITQKPRN